MERITIDDFIRVMKAKQLTRGVGELEGEKIRVRKGEIYWLNGLR